MAPEVLLAGMGFVVLAIAVVGLYEYTLYSTEQRARAPIATRVYLGAWLVAIAVGLGGIAVALAGEETSWAPLTVLLVVSGLLAPIQLWMHRRMGVEDGPLVERYL